MSLDIPIFRKIQSAFYGHNTAMCDELMWVEDLSRHGEANKHVFRLYAATTASTGSNFREVQRMTTLSWA